MSNVNFLASSFLWNTSSISFFNNRSIYNTLLILWFEGFLRYVLYKEKQKRITIGLSNRSVLGFHFHVFLSKGYNYKDSSTRLVPKRNFLEIALLRRLRRNKKDGKGVFSIK